MVTLSLLIVTGLSGAGKSLALQRLEDNGYFCVDNLPSGLLPGFVEQCKTAAPQITRAAVAMDGREISFGLRGTFFDLLENPDTSYQILYLDCRNDILCHRYAETRRRHPFAKGGDLLLGIERERELLMPVRERAHMVIDTSGLTPLLFTNRLNDLLDLQPHRQMALVFSSFGFKRGMPIDADIVLDTRFLPNPFYDKSLRPLSGLDKPVREYLLQDDQVQPFLLTTEQLLTHILPGFARQGKQRVMVAFGCTGGRHRSVFAAEEMARRMAGGPYEVRCTHRDYQVEETAIHARFHPESQQ